MKKAKIMLLDTKGRTTYYNCLKKWPEDDAFYCQCGSYFVSEKSLESFAQMDIYPSKKNPKRLHSFFQIYDAKTKLFIEGTGKTIQAAERDAWKRWKKIIKEY